MKMFTEMSNPLNPVCTTFIDVMIYKDSDTEFEWKVVSEMPNQYVYDFFKYNEKWEVHTPFPGSNQVVLRKSHEIEWLYKPWGIWSIMQNEIKRVLGRLGDSYVEYY
jgi:hypothetical protein